MPEKKTSGLALASFIIAILSIIPIIGFLPAILALILGIIAFNKINNSENLGGKGLAITAIILSCIIIAGNLFLGMAGRGHQIEQQNTAGQTSEQPK